MQTSTGRSKPDRSKAAPVAWKMHVCILLFGLTVAGIVTYGLYSGIHLVGVDAPLLQAAMKTRLEVVTTNLVIEGLLGDGFVGDPQPAWQPLDAAFLEFQSAFRRNKKFSSLPVLHAPHPSPERMGEIASALSELKERAFERLTRKTSTFIDEDVDRRYRLAFDNLMSRLGTLENELQRTMDRNLVLFRYSQAGLLALCVLMLVLASVMFHRFERQRTGAFSALEEKNDEMQREIEQRLRSEEALRASEERFRQLAENIMDLFWLEDVSGPGNVIYISPTFDLWWGCAGGNVYADRDRLWDMVLPEERDHVTAAYRRFISGEGQFDVEFKTIRQDGSVRWIHARGYPIRDAGGRMFRIAGLAQDITGQKRQEALQKQLLAELKDFSYAVSHDFRAPLANVKGFSREIREELQHHGSAVDKSGLQTEDLQESLGFIDASVGRMERLIAAILKLSRLGRRDLQFERLDVNALVAGTLKTFAFQIQTRGIRVSVDSLPETTADRVSLEQVFANLLSNAIKFLKPEGNGEIRIGGESRLDENVFYVADNGCGIAEADRERVFNMFERLGRNRDDGEGMGLAYVRTLVRRHGGEVFCEPESGAGTRFIFSISKNLIGLSPGSENITQ